ncbi:MAG: TrmH family RNA methyltransferase [Oscillospiraceae bacterium]|nr:TrmH family RNA methyltransferase [Oscillospiraceae bacterium]
MQLLQKLLIHVGKKSYHLANRIEGKTLYTYSEDSDVTYAEGATLIHALLLNDRVRVNRIIAVEYPTREKMFDEALSIAEQQVVPVIKTEKHKERLRGLHKGFLIAAEVNKPETKILPGDHLLIYDPAIPRNVGAIVRSAAAFGICDVAIINREHSFDLNSPQMVRSSMGARLLVRVEEFPDVESYRARFPENKLYAFMLDPNACGLAEAKKETPFTLIFGNETMGLPEEFADYCQPVFIEQENTIDSLNLSSAAAIALYTFLNKKDSSGDLSC